MIKGGNNYWIWFIFFSAILMACNGTGEGQASSSLPSLPQAWIDAPLSNSILPLEPYKIVFSAASDAEVDGFEIIIDGISMGSVAPSNFSVAGDNKYFTGDYVWEITIPGVYLIKVIANADGKSGPSAEAIVTIGEPVSLQPDSPSNIEPVIQLETNELLANLPQDTNCRIGCQASQFDIADSLIQGFQYPINAISSDGFFVQFIGPATGQICWAPLSLIDLQLNGQSVELAAISEDLYSIASCPSTPTPLPTATFTPEPTKTDIPPTAVPLPECNDGIDNDGDGDIDMADGRCLSPTDDSESS